MKEVTRLFDFPYYQLEHAPTNACFATKYNGVWEKISTQEYIKNANAISRALLQMGVQPNDKIAVISSTNRTEWNITDIGIMQLGAQNVPIYPTISKDDYAYILNHSESIYCFVSDVEVYGKLKAIMSQTKLKEVFCFDKIEGCINYRSLIKQGEALDNQEAVEALKNKVKPQDLATIIYTSGTTGKPKGVMLSHQNIASNALSASKRLPQLNQTTRVLSFLPICHIFERCLIYIYQYTGAQIYFAEGIDKIGDNAKEIKPHLMSVVPRLLEKVFDKIMAKASSLSFPKKNLFMWAVKLGEQYNPYHENGWWYGIQLKIARKLIFSKWQDALGGELFTMVSGSAPLQLRLARIFCASGMKIMEGYGLTETSPVVSVGQLKNGNFKIGTVGKPIDGVEVKIESDGEILIKGPNVMLGYFKDKEKTNEVMSGSYFHTGDKGEIDSDGFLKITGRKKEMFKTSGGKYVVPALLENELKQSRFIEQIMVVGEGEKMPAALIQPNFEFLEEWIKRKELDIETSQNNLCINEKVRQRIQKEVDSCNQNFGKWEQIKKFELTPEVWSIDEGHLTPTMKMKRKIILEKYKSLYEKIYR